MTQQEIARQLLADTAGLSAQAVRLQIAIVAGYDRSDIDGLAALLNTSRRSVYRWLQEIDAAVSQCANPVTPLEAIAREAEEIAKQVRDLSAVPEMAETVPNLTSATPLSPQTPLTPEKITSSPPPIVPPRRRRRSGPSDEEMAMVTAIVSECNTLWGKRFSPQAHSAYIVRRLRAFPEVTLDEHLEIVRTASANPWWDGEPSPRVIYSRDDLFDSMRQQQGTAPRRQQVSSRAERQRQLLGGSIFEEVSNEDSANSRTLGVPLARLASH